MNTDYREGEYSEFIEFLFSEDPKPPHTIVYECPPPDSTMHHGLHVFEQMLMIFVDGLKYFHENEEGKVNVDQLTPDDKHRMTQYFQSMGYELVISLYETINEYQFRYPNYFKDKEKITSDTRLSDFYYEIYGQDNRVFRVSFRHLTDTSLS
jgi:hypothetical protein